MKIPQWIDMTKDWTPERWEQLRKDKQDYDRMMHDKIDRIFGAAPASVSADSVSADTHREATSND